MAMLDSGTKQRIVGALVLVALAVIFLPMLLSRPDELRHVVVDAPSIPAKPVVPEIEMQPVIVPDPQELPQEPIPGDSAAAGDAQAPVEQPIVELPADETPVATPAPQPTPSKPAEVTPPPQKAPAERLDANSLPVSWSVQLASLSSRPGAETLQKTLRAQGYNAYIRSVDGMNRVFVGPLIERVEADRLRDQLNRQHKLNGFVVRFQPESN
ncbi:cell division protein [Pseudomonas daroniae]|uniref:Cell division protein n=1 Tax=Phytopseudomonas daroniae TaxID=2487519 RepID=A0A4Q9QR91_9GAMM|nr:MULTISPECIES: SPOR domain-containing protein [Pseudomonas]TBU83349.1 cell division protein [Pseudomonas daroniae]TBU84988.1 cell division protein [Pseudomonas sp. FRB 228]TBU93719.1 cell division protein [Pseudomonas daroniae]